MSARLISLFVGSALCGAFLLSNATVERGVPGPDNVFGVGELLLGSPPPPDSDNDGFDDAVEAHVGTDPLDACPDDPTDDAWPPDIVIDTVVDIFDALTFLPAFPSAEGGPHYSQRLDFSPDGVIDTFDAITFLNHFPSACTP